VLRFDDLQILDSNNSPLNDPPQRGLDVWQAGDGRISSPTEDTYVAQAPSIPLSLTHTMVLSRHPSDLEQLHLLAPYVNSSGVSSFNAVVNGLVTDVVINLDDGRRHILQVVRVDAGSGPRFSNAVVSSTSIISGNRIMDALVSHGLVDLAWEGQTSHGDALSVRVNGWKQARFNGSISRDTLDNETCLLDIVSDQPLEVTCLVQGNKSLIDTRIDAVWTSAVIGVDPVNGGWLVTVTVPAGTHLLNISVADRAHTNTPPTGEMILPAQGTNESSNLSIGWAISDADGDLMSLTLELVRNSTENGTNNGIEETIALDSCRRQALPAGSYACVADVTLLTNSTEWYVRLRVCDEVQGGCANNSYVEAWSANFSIWHPVDDVGDPGGNGSNNNSGNGTGNGTGEGNGTGSGNETGGGNQTVCDPGATQPAADGCNTCTCATDGSGWSCTEISCSDSGGGGGGNGSSGVDERPGPRAGRSFRASAVLLVVAAVFLVTIIGGVALWQLRREDRRSQPSDDTKS
jgi:hypothetical protein